MKFGIAKHLRRGIAAGFAAALVLAAALPAAGMGKIEKVTSPGGITAWLVQDRLNPIIAMQVVFIGGSIADPDGKEGLAQLTAAMMYEGAGALKSQAFQKAVEDKSIDLGFSAGSDTFSGSLKTLTKNRDMAFDLFRLAMTEPRFDAEPLSRTKTQILVNLARRARDPNVIAGQRWWSSAYPDFPYGRRTRGTPETVKAIAPNDMRGFLKSRLARNNVFIGVVGDITPDELKVLLDKTFGGLPEKAVALDLAETPPKLDGRTEVIRRPFPQSRVIFGQAGIKRDHKDWYAAYVLNQILASGSFTSRLMKEVREKRGLVYSVGAGLNPMRYSATLVGSLGTQNARVAKSIELVRAEWKRMKEEGATKEEVEDAIRYLTGSFALSLDSTSRIASTLASVQYLGLGLDYLDNRNSFIEAVTVDDVNRVARELLTPEKLTFVVVGQPENLE